VGFQLLGFGGVLLVSGLCCQRLQSLNDLKLFFVRLISTPCYLSFITKSIVPYLVFFAPALASAAFAAVAAGLTSFISPSAGFASEIYAQLKFAHKKSKCFI